MNIEVNSKVTSTNNVSTTSSSKNQSDDSVKFSDELSSLSSKKAEKTDKAEDAEMKSETEAAEDTEKNAEQAEKAVDIERKSETEEKTGDDKLENIIDGLEDVVAEMNHKLNKPEKEDNKLINNDMNIQEQKDLQMFQMNANMNLVHQVNR